MKKRHLLLFLIPIVVVIILIINSLQFKFLYELLKLSASLPTVSSDFYTDPIENITYKDVVYKERDGLELTLDIYQSSNMKKPSPVLIYVFGNGWIEGSKVIPTGIEPIIELMKNEGYTIISTSYELMDDEIIFYDQVSDIKDTIRWVYKNTDKYNFDVTNIGLIGPSAGAQLSMLASYSNNNEFIGDKTLEEYPSNIKYVVDLFGPTVLEEINFSDVPSKYMKLLNQEYISEISEAYSPINYLKDDLPNTLIIHSLNDSLIPYETSKHFYNEAMNYNNKFEFLTLNDCTHYLENMSEQEALKLYMTIVNFIATQTK